MCWKIIWELIKEGAKEAFKWMLSEVCRRRREDEKS